MCCEGDTAARLRAAGLRVTRQRIEISCALRHAGRHVSAEQIQAQLGGNRAVEMSTIYRTLARLQTLGLAAQADAGVSVCLFEWREGALHHHLVCAGCGDITEMDTHPISSLVELVRSQYRFEVDLSRF